MVPEPETLKRLMIARGLRKSGGPRGGGETIRGAKRGKAGKGFLGTNCCPFSVTRRLLTCALIFLASTSAFGQVHRGPDQLTLYPRFRH